ncbi:MAG: hypothetical protein ACOVOV_18760 [Dolichospermum sp.]
MIASTATTANTLKEYDPITLRYEMGWTLERLAEELGVSYSSALKWSCKKRNPSKAIRRLTAHLKNQI